MKRRRPGFAIVSKEFDESYQRRYRCVQAVYICGQAAGRISYRHRVNCGGNLFARVKWTTTPRSSLGQLGNGSATSFQDSGSCHHERGFWHHIRRPAAEKQGETNGSRVRGLHHLTLDHISLRPDVVSTPAKQLESGLISALANVHHVCLRGQAFVGFGVEQLNALIARQCAAW